MLSTRYGKIEDLIVGMRVALPNGRLIDSVSAPRHAVGPDVTQLLVGAEGTLGVITRATLEIVPLPAERTFAALHFPTVEAGVTAFRTALARGLRPSVIRMYDEEATTRTLSPVWVRRWTASARSWSSRGVSRRWPPRSAPPRSSSRAQRARASSIRLGRDVVEPALRLLQAAAPPRAPSIWGTIDVVASYRDIHAVHQALRTAVRDRYAPQGLQLRMHFSHWYRWGTMIYARFLIPDGGPTRWPSTTRSGRTA